MAKPKSASSWLPRCDFKFIERFHLLRAKLELVQASQPIELEMAEAAVQVRGGMKIHCNGADGTATIACFQETDGKMLPVLITAGHVVGNATSSTVVNLAGGAEIGTVRRVHDNPDTAVVKLHATVEGLFEIIDETDGSIIHPFNFTARCQEGAVEMVGAVSGHVFGKCLRVDAKVNVNDVLTNQDNRNLTRTDMIEIEPTTNKGFGVPGDSGSPILQKDSKGKRNIVGLLVAVMKDGVQKLSYAEHFGDPGGVASLLHLNETE